ncbi:peptide MFS transporter [Sphingomonas sp.]|uniref:peptide MFS transporter n=1 Tax=Sphingomonas sp. TaxID=28214 RepID=UPI0025D7A82B|nr:peptide MFS transporter [Sphingomonas sp.]MBV9526901.1 peptide MFS transporter [Sphingomonas sp.]
MRLVTGTGAIPERAKPVPTLFGHPAGLTVLFTTQMWAEFSFFGLQALLVYYMTKHLGFSQAKSSLIYGAYGGAAFFSPFFGGLIADRWLGRTMSVIIGAAMMMAGHFAMAFESLLFPALALVALGNGLFIPPLAIQVGSLYADDDPRKAYAYSTYYMGINLGGLIAPLVCGTLGELYGWHWGFTAAGIGMAIGLAIYLSFLRLLPAEPSRGAIAREESDAAAPIVREHVAILLIMVAMVVLFRIGYEQSGNVIALWVSDFTDRSLGPIEIPATWFQSINPLLIIVGTPILIRIWRRGDRKDSVPHLLRRMAIGCVIATAAMLLMVAAAAVSGPAGARVSSLWVFAYFVLLTLGELFVIPVGLTLVESLAPVRFASMAMGGWYIAKFLGSLLAGVMGAYWLKIPASAFFGLGCASTALAAICLFAMARVTARREPA